MEIKDWILLLTPLVSNGILILFFQPILMRKTKQKDKRQDMQDKVITLFWEKLQKLNTIIIQANCKILTNPDYLFEGLNLIKENVFDIVEYYDTNYYDLGKFENEYNTFNNLWNEFADTLKEYTGK